MNTKAKGARNERRTVRRLEAADYACTRAAEKVEPIRPAPVQYSPWKETR